MVEHNADLPSVQADRRHRQDAARELLLDYTRWLVEQRAIGGYEDSEHDFPTDWQAEQVNRYLEEVDRG